jgi:hypothetical protein
MNRYLTRLRGLNFEKQAPAQTLKTLKTGSEVGFEGFEGSRESPFSENRDSQTVEKASPGNPQNPQNLTVGSTDDPLTAGLWTLETCPAYVPEPRWRQAIRDGQAFLDQWRDQALALGWQPADLFGLHQPPANPHPLYSRLSRYDQTGLCWLLNGAQVIALSSETAVMRTPSGATLRYRLCMSLSPSWTCAEFSEVR